MRARSLAAVKAIAAEVGLDELLLVFALTLVTVGLWPVVGRVALLAPGVVVLYMALPSRDPFIVRTPAPKPEKSVRRKR